MRQLTLQFEVGSVSRVRALKISGDSHSVTRSLDRQAQDYARRTGCPLTDALIVVYQKHREFLPDAVDATKIHADGRVVDNATSNRIGG